MIPPEKIQEIRARASIVEIISDYLNLKKTGQNHLGLCPFHSEKTPSFTVNDEKGIFHCFGCGVGGTVFNFLMRYDHLNFPEAVERLAKRYGVQLPQTRTGRYRKDEPGTKEPLYRLNERASVFFQTQLRDPVVGRRAQRYLTGRGIDGDIAQRFGVGFAPGGQGLVHFFQQEGLSLEDGVRVGLLSRKDRGRYADKFFDRIMFPITEPSGRVVAFGGRVMGQGLPKYLNSPETPLFRKRSQLYGLFQAREAIRSHDRVLVVEGYLDVLALMQFRVQYAVATLGTALTPEHVSLLGRYTKNIIALFDGDEAGRKAAARGLEIFLEAGLLGQAAFLPAGEDPDSFVRAHGQEAVESLVERAVPLVDFYLNRLEHEHGRDLGGKSRIAAEVSRLLARVRNPLDRDLLARRAADVLGIREELLRQQAVPNLGRAQSSVSRNLSSPRTPVREDVAESSLVGLMLRFPSLLRRIENEPLDNMVAPTWRPVIQSILDDWKQRGEVQVASLAERLSPDLVSEVSALVLREEIGEKEAQQMTEDCLFYLRRRHLKALEEGLRREIRLAEERKDDEVKKERMRQWQEVVQKERSLERTRLSL